MTLNINHNRASEAQIKSQKNISKKKKYAEMNFNVIVSFWNNKSINEKRNGDLQEVIDISVVVYEYTSYDEIMSCVCERVIDTVSYYFNLTRDDIMKISTCANWNKWEELTGLNCDYFMATSKLAPNGKIYF